MKVSALDNKVVQERAAELKKRSERNAEATKLRDQQLLKARESAAALKAEAMSKPGSVQNAGASKSAPAPAAANEPAAVVEISKAPDEASPILAGVQIREADPENGEGAKYSPEEVQAKARALLDMNVLPPDQRKVLEEIITKQEISARRK